MADDGVAIDNGDEIDVLTEDEKVVEILTQLVEKEIRAELKRGQHPKSMDLGQVSKINDFNKDFNKKSKDLGHGSKSRQVKRTCMRNLMDVSHPRKSMSLIRIQ